jgi:N6-adenosine-specific RNA methylase IME4
VSVEDVQSDEDEGRLAGAKAIKGVRVPAARDAVLSLWSVSALLREALDAIESSGCEYKSSLVWVKQSIGPGVWVRNRHELLLVARRGNYPPPEPEERVDSVLEAPRGRHSAAIAPSTM